MLLLVGELGVHGFLPCDVIFTDVPSRQTGLMDFLQQLGIRAIVIDLPRLLVGELAAIGHIPLELDSSRIAQVVGFNLDDRPVTGLHMTGGTTSGCPYVSIVVKLDFACIGNTSGQSELHK